MVAFAVPLRFPFDDICTGGTWKAVIAARRCVVAPAFCQASYLHAPIAAFPRETISTRDQSAHWDWKTLVPTQAISVP